MLDDDNGGEGEPIPDDGPEWGSVEAERDYWKGLALSYGAKLKALEHTLAGTWTVRQDSVGKLWAVDEAEHSYRLDSLFDVAKKLP